MEIKSESQVGEGHKLAALTHRIDHGKIEYPPAPRDDSIVEEIHGVFVPDPFRPLENPDAHAVREWLRAQAALAKGFLAAIPEREAIAARYKELLNYRSITPPGRMGACWFWTEHDGKQNFPVYYVSGSPAESGRVLLDPNLLSDDGSVSASMMGIDDQARYLAYSISESGSDWQTVRIRDIATGGDLPDVLSHVKFSGASWDKEAKGFIYARFPEPAPGQALSEINENQKLFYHRLGSPQSDDTLIYERPDRPRLSLDGGYTDDGRFLVIAESEGTSPNNNLLIQDLVQNRPLLPLFSGFRASYSLISNIEDTLYILTNQDAPNFKVIRLTLSEPRRIEEVIPESEHPIKAVELRDGKLLVHRSENVCDHLYVHGLSGQPIREIKLPGLGSVSGVTGRQEDSSGYFSFSSFDSPDNIYHCDINTGDVRLFRRSPVSPEPGSIITEQIWYPSKDGTKIPMFVVRHRDTRLGPDTPLRLYGYGGFNVGLAPFYSNATCLWLEMGGIYAQPSLRGGAEFGEAWHEAGMLHNKQNVFDDFISAAEWLVANGYTSSRKIAIEGGSNGGLLVGACLTQRPDLFGAAIPDVGVMDMLRFDRFTIGHAWKPEYGDPANPDDFRILHGYSPLHNLRSGVAYPPTLVKTSDHDDRVHPSHSFKFAARLQEVQAGSAPCLLHVEIEAGHGGGTPLSKVIEEVADRYAFLVKVLEMKPELRAPAS